MEGVNMLLHIWGSVVEARRVVFLINRVGKKTAKDPWQWAFLPSWRQKESRKPLLDSGPFVRS